MVGMHQVIYLAFFQVAVHACVLSQNSQQPISVLHWLGLREDSWQRASTKKVVVLFGAKFTRQNVSMWRCRLPLLVGS